MVAKISSGNSIYSALAYNQNKVEDSHAKVIFSQKIITNADGNFDISACLRSFDPYLSANLRTGKHILHISINPDPKDKLSDEQLSEIAQTYMQKMGYGAQPFIVYKHEDIERRHIHIVSVRVDEYGRKINDKFEHRRSMDVCRELEQQYKLIPADQKQKSQSSLLSLKPVNYKDGDVKHQIANVIRPIAQQWHFQSLKEYRALLTLYNTGVEEVRGEIKGKPYKGLIYSALDKKGNEVGNPFKSSLFGKSVGVDGLEKRMKKSAEIIKSKRLKDRSKQVISAVMQNCHKRKDFEKTLERQGISVIFRENEQGKIYGATFIDHEQKCVFNGSRLGKEFSANAFNDLFNVNQPSQESHLSHHNRDFDENSNSGGIFDFLTFDSATPADDIEEQNFVNRLKKKRKQQRKI